MSFLNNLFGNKSNSDNTTPVTNPETVTNVPVAPRTLNLTKEAPLNLQKNDVLNLSKSAYILSRLRACAGWDVNAGRGASYDLDLCAYLQDKNGRIIETIYFGNKGNVRKKGIELDEDNLTGEGDGDDENIFLNLDAIPNNVSKITIAVVIYSAASRGQHFGQVKNAYIRLVDESDNDREMFRYNLSNDGGNNRSVIAGEVFRGEDGWNFFARGEYSRAGSIQDLSRQL